MSIQRLYTAVDVAIRARDWGRAHAVANQATATHRDYLLECLARSHAADKARGGRPTECAPLGR